MVSETLYNLRATSFQGKGSPWTPTWILPNVDLTEETLEPLVHVFRTQADISYLDLDLGRATALVHLYRPARWR